MAKDTNAEKSQEIAVFEAAGKQYLVSVGDVVTLDKSLGEKASGDKITFDKVLLVDNGKEATVGQPYVKGASVEALFEDAGRSKKILVWRFRAKSRYSRKYGHRQDFTTVKISAIKTA